ncbi:MAG: ATP-binding protein [Minwuia sp.]|nr:ATP-binding protein [Minwuia sp.]
MNASPKSRRAEFTCDLREVRNATLWVERQARDLGFDDKAVSRMAVAFEELFANSVHHGGALPDASVRLQIQREQDGSIRLDFRDNGIHFDPVADADRVTGDPVAGAVGGVGVRLAINLSSAMTYTRESDGNHVSLVFQNR